MRRLLAVPLLVLLLGACQSAINIPGFTSPPITNPVTSVDVYRVKNVYAATLQLVVSWREYCWKRPYAVLMADPIAKPVCQNRRPRLRQIQNAQTHAGVAVRYAEKWVAENPTVSAASVIGPAWDAVTAFQQLVPKIN